MLETIFHRRSIRRYLPTPVEEEKITLLLKAAMYAPSASNRQPWHFLVVDDRALLDRIRAVHPYAGMLRTAPLCILVLGDRELELPGYHVVDCAAATQNILLAADSLGLGSCWMGVEPREERVRDLRELFSIPERLVPSALVAVGYPDEQPALPERFRPERVYRNRL